MRVIVWSKMDYLKNVKLCNSFEQNSMHQRIVSKIETDAKINFLRITNPFPISQCHSNDVHSISFYRILNKVFVIISWGK